MTVYVDNARIPATVGSLRGRWSHLTADTVEELHVFAGQIGLARSWFQTCKNQKSCPPATCPHWHYDVTDSKRAEAIRLGAQEMDLRQWGAICSARREAQRAAGSEARS